LFYKKAKFKIKNNIKTGIEKTIEWYLKNKTWAKFQKNRYINKRIGLDDK
jgi:dTDP-D-glucose 4,6-dehydratase